MWTVEEAAGPSSLILVTTVPMTSQLTTYGLGVWGRPDTLT